MATRKTPQTPTVPKSPTPTIIQHQPETKVRVMLEVPQSLFAIYEEQGANSNRMAEDEMLQRLHKCRDYTALKPLYLDDAQRQRLERALEHNISNADVAIAQICTAISIQVGDVGVEIPSQLARRISTRVFRGESYEDVVRREVIKGLSIFAGLLPG